MSEMIDRVANALCDEFSPGIRKTEADWLLYKQTAKVSIEAMRQPTTDMIIAGDCVTIDEEPDCLEFWNAMINKALE